MARLNFDVLCDICGFLTDVPDVLSFSLTCSTLRPVAVERRLRMRAIILYRAKSIHDLYNFIFVDQKRRGPHIRAITIPVHDTPSEPSEDLVDCLLAVIASARRVRSLSLYVPQLGHDGQSSLFNHPRVLPAIAEMTSLQELDILAHQDVATFLLESTRSALKTFRHSDMYDDEDDGGPSGSLTFNIAPQFAHALQEVEWSAELLAMASKSCVSLPAVRSVTLMQVLDPVQLDMLPTVFPNLDHSLIIHDVTGNLDSNHLVAHRAKNCEAQKTRAWKALDRVAARPTILYALALACPIHHLTLDMTSALDIDRDNDSHLVRACAILEDWVPTYLALANLHLPHGRFSGLDRLKSIFPSGHARSRITHIVLDVKYRNIRTRTIFGERQREESWDAVLDSLPTALENLRLTHVRINITSAIDNESPISAAVQDGLRSFKFDRLIFSLSARIPSLSLIFITSIGILYNVGTAKGREAWEMSRAWRVRRPCVGNTGGMSLEELSAEDEKAAIDREAMRATERTYWIRYEDSPTLWKL